MVIVGILNGVVELCVSINEDQLQSVIDTYPDMLIQEQVGEENIGWTFVNGTFSPPIAPDLSNSWKISRLAFISRFTDAEAIAIDLASSGATVQQAAIRRLFQKVNASEYIDLKRSDTITGVNMLVQFQLLSQTRADEILNTVPTVKEIYRGNV